MPDRRSKSPAPKANTPPPKACATCGRLFSWRKKWERDWPRVKFCSDSCRAHKPSDQDHALEAAILDLLHERGADKTICPSEAARAVAAASTAPGPQGTPVAPSRTAWEPLMEPARAAARRLVAEGKLLITQGGHTVDPSTARGPIRLRLP